MALMKNLPKVFANSPRQETEAGNELFGLFLPDERYVIDFADDFRDEGWQQYDTDQDAHYFGVWVNPVLFQTLSYVEGDWSWVKCANEHQYQEEIDSMNAFYKPAPAWTVIDASGSITHVYDETALHGRSI